MSRHEYKRKISGHGYKRKLLDMSDFHWNVGTPFNSKLTLPKLRRYEDPRYKKTSHRWMNLTQKF